MIAPLVLAAALQSAATAEPAIGTFVDPKSKEELVTLESGGAVQVFYASASGKHRQELKVKGELYGNIFQVTFPDPSKKYVIEWTRTRDVITCSNPDGTQQKFERVDLDRPPFKTPEAVVRAIYAQYPEQTVGHKTLDFLAVSADERATYLTPELAEAVENLVHDNLPAPLYDDSTPVITNLKVGNADRDHVVPVMFEDHGKKRSFKVTTRQTPGGWVIANVNYGQRSLTPATKP